MLPAVMVLLGVSLLIVVPVCAVVLWTARKRRTLDDREFAIWFRRFLFGIDVPRQRAGLAHGKRTSVDIPERPTEKRAR